MNNELLPALAAFVFVSSITPGPNNLMLMSSGANFGFKRTIPHMLGVGFGIVFMVFLVGIGLTQVFDAYPISYEILKVFSIAYLLYLAFRIATDAPGQNKIENNATPITFLQAASFQWVNPKAWTMALTAVSVFSQSCSLESVALVAAIFGLVNLPSISVWAILGQQLRRMLTSHFRQRAFNLIMAALLLGSLYPIFV